MLLGISHKDHAGTTIGVSHGLDSEPSAQTIDNYDNMPLKPLGVISSSNQSGLILILTALSLSFIVVSFVIRVYIRVPTRLWKWDDNSFTAATVSA